MAGKRAGTLLALMERMQLFTLNRVWTELSDDEFFWEPVDGVWGALRDLYRWRTVTRSP